MENLNNDLIHDLDSPVVKSVISRKQISLMIGGFLIAGLLLGFIFAKINSRRSGTDATTDQANVEKSAGIADKKTFKDQAEGILKEGGIDGEGNFHLERPGGVSQNVYLTSTTVDLSKYINKKVRVWGETFKAEKAGWLMDVGLIELQ